MSIEVEGLEEVQNLLARVYSQSGNLEPVMDEIGDKLLVEIQHSFANEMSPWGVPWKRSQRAEATNTKTLYKSKRLHDSFKFESTINSVKVGTNVKYAPIHNYGGQAGRGRSVTMPQRQFMPIDNSNNLPPYLWTDIANIIRGHLGVD